MLDLAQSMSAGLLALSPLARQQRLSILIYHRVMKERDWLRPGEPTVDEFAWQMQLLERHFTVLPLRDAIHMLKNGSLPPRAVCVSFDDGYADNATLAQPILQRHAIPATVFVAAKYLNGGRMWNDTVLESLRDYSKSELDLSRMGLTMYPTGNKMLRRKAAYDIIRRCKYLKPGQREELADCIAGQASFLPDNLMMTTTQLLTLHRQGVAIGGHTFSHPILAKLPAEQAQEEIQSGKTELEYILGEPLYLFAYPNGRCGMDFNQEHANLVKQAGFEAAVTTSWGVATRQSDLFHLPRFTPWDKSTAKFILRMALNGCHVAQTSGEYAC